MQFYVFFFFSGWLVIMTVFVWLCLPETKGVPIEAMERVFREHWLWGKVVGSTSQQLEEDSPAYNNGRGKSEPLSEVTLKLEIASSTVAAGMSASYGGGGGGRFKKDSMLQEAEGAASPRSPSGAANGVTFTKRSNRRLDADL